MTDTDPTLRECRARGIGAFQHHDVVGDDVLVACHDIGLIERERIRIIQRYIRIGLRCRGRLQCEFAVLVVGHTVEILEEPGLTIRLRTLDEIRPADFQRIELVLGRVRLRHGGLERVDVLLQLGLLRQGVRLRLIVAGHARLERIKRLLHAGHLRQRAVRRALRRIGLVLHIIHTTGHLRDGARHRVDSLGDLGDRGHRAVELLGLLRHRRLKAVRRLLDGRGLAQGAVRRRGDLRDRRLDRVRGLLDLGLGGVGGGDVRLQLSDLVGHPFGGLLRLGGVGNGLGDIRVLDEGPRVV